MLNVEKTIRVLGYILYNILWLPIIAPILVLAPIMVFVIGIRNGWKLKTVMQAYFDKLKSSFEHDKNFIKTGEW